MRSAAMRASAAQRRARARSNNESTSRDEKTTPSSVSVRMLSSDLRALLRCPNAVSSPASETGHTLPLFFAGPNWPGAGGNVRPTWA